MLERLYLINLSLIITHEIDSAYWQEWKMFNLPGGIQFFNILNFFLILILIHGYRIVARSNKNGFMFSLVMSMIGIAAFIIHSFFILVGYEQFTLPVSLIILTVCFITSLWQLIYTVQNRQTFVD